MRETFEEANTQAARKAIAHLEHAYKQMEKILPHKEIMPHRISVVKAIKFLTRNRI